MGGDPNPRLHPLGVCKSAKVKKTTQQKLWKYGVSVVDSIKKDAVKLSDNRQEKGLVVSTTAPPKDCNGRRKVTARTARQVWRLKIWSN